MAIKINAVKLNLILCYCKFYGWK